MAPLILTWYSDRSPSSARACPSLRRALPFLNPPLPSPSSSFPLSFVLPPTSSPLPPPFFSPHLLRLAAPCGAPCPSHNPPLHPPPPLLSPTSSLSNISSFLHLFHLFICCSCGTATDFSAAIPPLLVSPLIGATADYSAIFPPPLVSPLIGVAADYSAIFPPLLSPLISSAADYFDIFPPPLVSPRIGSATDYSATFPLLLFLPSAAQQQTTPPLFLRILYLSPYLLCSCFLLLMATSLALPSLPLLSGSVAIPTSPSAPTSSSSDPYADGLRVAIAETERLVATAQATATAAPENGAARDLARILTESLESTRKRLTEHLAAPSPRCPFSSLCLYAPFLCSTSL
ncbi:unnamed protein product [Closterium sp. NIES-65]|nr:unnamed protein product [Closterium sp. NIES-65]